MADASYANIGRLTACAPKARMAAGGTRALALAVTLAVATAAIVSLWLAATAPGTGAWADEPPQDTRSTLAAESGFASSEDPDGMPRIETTLVDGADGDHGATADEAITLVDIVSYSGVAPGVPYTLTGTLHVRADDGSDDGLARDGRGHEVTATEAFIPEADAGEASVMFAFSAPALAGKTVVAYEKLARDGRTCALHADIADDDQAIWFAPAHVMGGEPAEDEPPATPPPKESAPATAPTALTGMSARGRLPRTGDALGMAPLAIASSTALGFAVAALCARHLRKEREITISRGPARQRPGPQD